MRTAVEDSNAASSNIQIMNIKKILGNDAIILLLVFWHLLHNMHTWAQPQQPLWGTSVNTASDLRVYQF